MTQIHSSLCSFSLCPHFAFNLPAPQESYEKAKADLDAENDGMKDGSGLSGAQRFHGASAAALTVMFMLCAALL